MRVRLFYQAVSLSLFSLLALTGTCRAADEGKEPAPVVVEKVEKVDKADQAEAKASKASEQASEASEKAEAATTEATEAAKQAAKAADKAAQAAEKVDTLLSKAEVNREEATISSASNRLTHQIGGYVSLWGDPFPATLGVNAAYNVYDWARVNLGIGSDSAELFRTTTAGLGIKFMVPRWPLTPVVGANLSFTKSESSSPRTVRGFDPRGTHPYLNAGIDWETGIGLNFTVGYNIPLQSGVSGFYYLNAGVFL